MKTNENPQILKAALEVLDNQLRDNNPPETKQTLERLFKAGFTKDAARRLLAGVILIEINAVLREMKPFNTARFIKSLKSLPELSE